METDMAISADIQKKMAGYPAFYQAVWRACAEIPSGETRTYGWIAKRIGRPGVARAVGRALGANPFAPLVPCHRVVGADGRLVGYSGAGGVEAKRRLLEREGAIAPEGALSPSLKR
jgi:methylated-DNA-[protein]-cysteine S-methyltransferase